MHALLLALLATAAGEPFVARRAAGIELRLSPALAVEVDALAAEARAASERVAARLGRRPAGTVFVYADLEEKALATGSTADVSLLDRRTAACVHDPPAARFDGRAVAALALAAALPGVDPTHPLLVATRSVLADEDERERCRALAAWVHAAGETTPLADLLDPPRCARRSFLLQGPLLAVVTELLLEEGGPAALADAARGHVRDPRRLEEAYRRRLDDLLRGHQSFFEQRRRRRARHRTVERIRGACFAHEGYRIVDGYGSRMAERSLHRLRALGADAVSVTPFAFYRDPARPEISWRRRTPETGNAAGWETDEAVRATVAQAHRLGLRVLLKPHLWGHGWCGEVAMRNDEDWRAFFERYGEFVVHHALLAETTDCEWFAVGCELVGATRGHEEEWRRLIDRVRALFAGGVTYAANWDREAPGLAFADALDFLGVDDYAPLVEAEEATDAQLLAGARRRLDVWEGLAERSGRPVVLTEIGFPDRRAAWLRPHEGRGGPPSPTDQARCLAAFAAAYGHCDRRRVPGFFVWKWPTFERWDDARRTDFWPASERALAALARAFAVP